MHLERGRDDRAVIIEPGSYHLLNAGDVAMMQIAIERLGSIWPGASFHIVTSSPDRLASACPSALPLSASKTRPLGAGLPGVARRYTKAGIGYRRFAKRVANARLFMVSGAGYFTDPFESHALSILDEIQDAISAGVPTALVGHGIGPVESTRLRERMARTLPAVEMIGLREGRHGPDLLHSLGVDASRIVVTGDDAIEVAFRVRPQERGTSIGVNLRLASYAGLLGPPMDIVRRALRRVMGDLPGTDLVPIVISRHPADAEVGDLPPFLESGSSEPVAAEYRSPEDVIRTIGSCRVVVSSSYHAGVFAASQGIPVVGIATSDYYRDKFLGLQHQFGEGVRMVDLDTERVEGLVEAINSSWRRADELHAGLLDAAVRQMSAGRDAYSRVHRVSELA